jgi:hypothetical protein
MNEVTAKLGVVGVLCLLCCGAGCTVGHFFGGSGAWIGAVVGVSVPALTFGSAWTWQLLQDWRFSRSQQQAGSATRAGRRSCPRLEHLSGDLWCDLGQRRARIAELAFAYEDIASDHAEHFCQATYKRCPLYHA